MKKSYNKAFTLVELLAVIVILAIILVIAVPKIMDVINSSKKSTLETSVKMIASSAEKTKMQNAVLGKEDATITCDSVAKLSNSDYESCTIEFDGNTAKVTVKGKGKFEGLNVCGGTKNEATAQKEMCATDGKYFSYEYLDAVQIAEIIDVSKCTAYLNELYPNTDTCPTCEEDNSALCNGTFEGYTISAAVNDDVIPFSDFEEAGLDVKLKSVVVEDISKCTTYFNEKACASANDEEKASCEEFYAQICNGTFEGYTISDAVNEGVIPSTDYEEAGLKMSNAHISITGYNIKGGLDVVIPSTIDGYTVTGISKNAFTPSGIIPDLISNNKKYYTSNLLNNKTKCQVVQLTVPHGLGIKSVVIPNSVTTIGESAFFYNELTEITIPSSVTTIGESAFFYNELTEITIPSSVTSVGQDAFADNPLSKVELSNPNIELGNCAFNRKENISTHNIPDTYECYYS